MGKGVSGHVSTDSSGYFPLISANPNALAMQGCAFQLGGCTPSVVLTLTRRSLKNVAKLSSQGSLEAYCSAPRLRS